MKGIDPRKGIIISHPRNGLHWVLYCIEYFTGLRTAGATKLIEKGDLAVYRTHNVKREGGKIDGCFCPFYDEKEKPLHNKIVLLLRDYRETFLRVAKTQLTVHNKTFPSPDEIRNGQVFNMRGYFKNLRAYDQFPGEKMLIRYPDLISDFSTVIKILDFFGLPYDLQEVKEFDIEYHRQRSIGIYDSRHTSYSKNNLYNFKYHRKSENQEVIDAIRDFANHNYPYLVKHYLRDNAKSGKNGKQHKNNQKNADKVVG